LHPSPDPAGPPARLALVTGGALRLGRAIVLALAGAGWDVAIHYQRSAAAAEEAAARVRALGRRAATFEFDLAADSGLERLFESCEAALGPVQCLVNNASRFVADSASDFTPREFDAHMRVNTLAPLQLARTLHARLPGALDGVVVNLLDQKLWNPNPDFFTYTLSKAALESATGLMARALAPRVRVVGVAPGISLPAPGQSQGAFEAAHRATPLGRGSTPEDVGAAVAYLAAARAVTGTTLLVDGGQHLLPTRRDILFLKTN